MTAETEHALIKASQNAAPADRPSTAATSVSDDVAARLPSLLAAIESEQRLLEDRFQAKVCVGWVHWVLRQYGLAAAQLPKDFDQEYPQYESLENLSEWTKVCALKSTYLKANCLAREGRRDKALEAFEAALPSLTGVWFTKPARQQLRYWAELFLTEYCMLASQAIRENEQLLSDPNCLSSFRTWSKYWAGHKDAPLPGGYGFRGSVPRRQVWSEYYHALSEILQRDLPFPTGYHSIGNESSARNQLRTELKKVEIIYQGLLYTETRFPKADEERVEIEAFVNRVMQNWVILNGRGWKEQDLGAGGRDSLSHGTLDTLYGAATKTYHSTAILRHLFTVHLAVAEFDLAFMSFDSYLELMKKGKARVEKTGHPEAALDDDGTMIETISACIAALCRYGGRDAAEKARKLAVELEHLIEKAGKNKQNGSGDGPPQDGRLLVLHEDEVSPDILALAWQAIGLAHAQWARVTYDSESRTQIQDKAAQCLRKSLSSEFGRAFDVRGVFALGLLYAEQRKLPIAIELVKTALLTDRSVVDGSELYNGPCWRERTLIPLWHLLALLLSARQEYVMAARACEGAIEQFKDPSILFGTRGLSGAYKSEHLNDVGAKDTTGSGIVDEMDDYEKESLLEIKMTQLAILELVEGPTVAVNASMELLTLFSRLFGDVEHAHELPTLEPPKTALTVRTRRGSFFGGRSERVSQRQSVAYSEKTVVPSSRPQTMQTIQSTTTTAPTISITNEQGDTRSRSARKSGSIRRKRSESGGMKTSMRKRSVSRGGPPVSLGGEKPFDDRNLQQYFALASKTGVSQDPAATSPVVGLRHSESHNSHTSRTRTNPDGSVLSADVDSFASLLPFVHFPVDHSRRRRRTMLVKVWLIIAGFYRRAGLFDDAQQACAEAQKIAQSLETEVANDQSGSLSVREPGWGETKSVEELYADVWSEVRNIRIVYYLCFMHRINTLQQQGYLSLARERPYQARADFESALMHFRDHPGAIVGLSDILMDIYSEQLLPPPVVPPLDLNGQSEIAGFEGSSSSLPIPAGTVNQNKQSKFPTFPSEPLGLATTKPAGDNATTSSSTTTANQQLVLHQQQHKKDDYDSDSDFDNDDQHYVNGKDWAYQSKSSRGRRKADVGAEEEKLPPPHKATSLPLVDRLAARDRAYGLLSGLVKLGTGWDRSEAWFALARAYEESGQVDKAKDALWWCVELEDHRGAREWACAGGAGGYVL